MIFGRDAGQSWLHDRANAEQRREKQLFMGALRLKNCMFKHQCDWITLSVAVTPRKHRCGQSAAVLTNDRQRPGVCADAIPTSPRSSRELAGTLRAASFC